MSSTASDMRVGMKRASPDGGASPIYCAGAAVEVFFRSCHTPDGSFPVTSYSAALLRPRVGRTDGWVTARVLADWPPSAETSHPQPIHVCYTHPCWSNRHGQILEPAEQKASRAAMQAAATGAPDAAALAYAAMCDGLHAPADVRPAGAGEGVHHPPPLLSVVAVRWGGDVSAFNTEQWGATSASVSDTYIDHFTNAVLYAALGPAYEAPHRHPCHHATPATMPPLPPRHPCRQTHSARSTNPTTISPPPHAYRPTPTAPRLPPHASQVLSIFVERGEDLDRLQPAPLLEGLSGAHKAGRYSLWSRGWG